MKALHLLVPLAAVMLIGAASPSAIAAAASRCDLAAGDIAWQSVDATTLSITKISPGADRQKLLCFGKWLRDNGVRMGMLSRPADPD
ncbi:MAG: hypothetical protein Q7J32_15725 [Sphingomonadaceae bacterium]|nr:hypothetical protein [Sphingomonadaceae bacterium]